MDYNKDRNRCIQVIKKRLQTLCQIYCSLSRDLVDNGKNNEAENVSLRFGISLERYPKFRDDVALKAGAMHSLAQIFDDVGRMHEFEWIQNMILSKDKSACHPLFESLEISSKRSTEVLGKLFEEESISTHESHLIIAKISASQRSTQCSKPGVSAMVVTCSSESIENPPPALFNLEPLHLAARQGSEDILINFLQAKMPVDDPELHHHTALFYAVANGHEGCCRILIDRGADCNKRNLHGDTILAAAVLTANLNLIKQVVVAGADVNPKIMCCTSSPLQLAVEHSTPDFSIALYLLEKGASVSDRRRLDGKNAMDLANEKGFAGLMKHQQATEQQQHHPSVYYPLDPITSSYPTLGFGNLNG